MSTYSSRASKRSRMAAISARVSDLPGAIAFSDVPLSRPARTHRTSPVHAIIHSRLELFASFDKAPMKTGDIPLQEISQPCPLTYIALFRSGVLDAIDEHLQIVHVAE